MGGQEEERQIVPGCNRTLHVRKRRHAYFGKTRRAAFLEHLAATCNVTASAETAGVSVSAVYANRMRDPEFREDWRAALEQGYARLEAALIARVARGDGRAEVRGDKTVVGPEAPEEVDWDKAMELLKHHQRGLAGRATGNRARPALVPIEQVAAKLVRKLKALGVRPADRSAAMAASERGGALHSVIGSGATQSSRKAGDAPPTGSPRRCAPRDDEGLEVGDI